MIKVLTSIYIRVSNRVCRFGGNLPSIEEELQKIMKYKSNLAIDSSKIEK